MKFSEMPYERPDIEALKKFLDDAAARLAAARSFEEADAVFLEVERGTAHAETMLTIAHIRHDINTADEFYDKEVEFSDRALPELEEYTHKWDLALLRTPFRADFERKYNRLMFPEHGDLAAHLLPGDRPRAAARERAHHRVLQAHRQRSDPL